MQLLQFPSPIYHIEIIAGELSMRIRIMTLIILSIVLTSCSNYYSKNPSDPSINNYYLNNRCDIHPGFIDIFISNGIIILIDNYNLRIQAFSERTKKQIWFKESKELLLNTTEIMSSFSDLNYESFVNRDCLFLVNKENIVCININSGAIVWERNFSMGEYSIDSFAKVSYDNKYIYFYIACANFRSYLFKINIKDGVLIKKRTYNKIHFFGKQFQNGDSIFIMGKKKTGKLYLLTVSQHDLKIKKKIRLNERNIYSVNMFLGDNALYIIDGNQVKSLNIPEMDSKWQITWDSKPGFQLELRNDTLYVIGNYYYFVTAINKNTGQIKWNTSDYSKILWDDRKFKRKNYTYYIPRPLNAIKFGNNYLAMISEFESTYISLNTGEVMKRNKYVETEDDLYYFSTADGLYKYYTGRIYEISYDNGNIIDSLFLEANQSKLGTVIEKVEKY